MPNQITKLQTYYGIPGSIRSAFLPSPLLTAPLVTVLKPHGVPGPPYQFPSIQTEFILFVGKTAIELNWMAEIDSIDTFARITILTPHAVPGPAWMMPIAYMSTILFVGKVATELNWIGEIESVNTITKTSLLKSYSLPGPALVLPLTYTSSIFLSGRIANQLSWSAPLLGMLHISQGVFDMAKQFCQQNDVGVKLIYQFLDQNGAPINVANATGLTIKIGYPDNTTQVPHSLDRAATLFSDGTDGKIYYITVGGDLNQFGLYMVQGKFTAAGKTYSGEKVPLQVLPNVDNN